MTPAIRCETVGGIPAFAAPGAPVPWRDGAPPRSAPQCEPSAADEAGTSRFLVALGVGAAGFGVYPVLRNRGRTGGSG